MSSVKGIRHNARQNKKSTLRSIARFAMSGVTAAGLLAGLVISGELETRSAIAAEALTPLEARLALAKAKSRQHFDSQKNRIGRDDKVLSRPDAPEAALAFGGSTKIQAGDGTPGDQFGGAVAISGTTIVIGANKSAANGSGVGAAYVYTLSGGAWVLQQKLTPADGEADDIFGYSVAISGDTIVVGAYGDMIGTNMNQGSAYVFTRSGSTWTQQQKLFAGDGAANDVYGRSVAIVGDTVVVGSPAADTTANVDQGASYVYTRSGTVWTQQAKLLGTDGAALDYFGDSVSISGDSVIVGATEDTNGTNTQQGSAYVFTRSGTSWTQQAKLTGTDSAAFDYFGFSVSIDANTAVVGTLANVGANFQQGSAYIFTRSGTTWTQQAKLLAADGGMDDSFGNSVFVLGDTVMVGAAGDTNVANLRQGSAYIFNRTGTTWAQAQKLLAADGAAEDQFGAGVGFTNNNAIVGSVGDTVGTNTFQGSAYIFSSDVSISGRVTTPGGQNLRNAVVSLIDSNGVRRTATTSSFGLYSFEGVRTGETYTLTVGSKRYRFSPRVLPVDAALANVDFVGLE